MICVGEYNSELAAAKREGGIFNLDEQYDKYNQCVVSKLFKDIFGAICKYVIKPTCLLVDKYL